MEPPQLIKEELINKLQDYLRKPENIGFIAGFSLTIVVAFLFVSRLYTRRKKPASAAHSFVKGSPKRRRNIIDMVVDSSLEYGMIFFLTLLKDYIVKYLERLNENITEHKTEISG